MSRTLNIITTFSTTAVAQYFIKGRPEINRATLQDMASVSTAFTVSRVISRFLADFASQRVEKDNQRLVGFFVNLASTLGLAYPIAKYFNLSAKTALCLSGISFVVYNINFNSPKTTQ